MWKRGLLFFPVRLKFNHIERDKSVLVDNEGIKCINSIRMIPSRNIRLFWKLISLYQWCNTYSEMDSTKMYVGEQYKFNNVLAF